MNIATHVERARQQYPNRTAVIFEGAAISYGALDEAANRVANALRRLDVTRGDRVALLLPNIPAFLHSYLGIQKIGAIAVSLNVGLKHDEIEFLLEDSGARVLITTEEFLSDVPTGAETLERVLIAEGAAGDHTSLDSLMQTSDADARAVEMKRDDPAVIVYSSGTTGFPKGATLSHGNVISNIKAKVRYTGMSPEDRGILFVPLFHCFGQNAVMNAMLHAGGTIVLHRRFDPDEVLASVREHEVTMFFAVPTIYILLLHKATVEDMSSVRYYFSAAATLPEEIARRWHDRFGIVINEGYGLTETSPFACYNHIERYKFGSIGTPIEGVEMKIVDPDDGGELDPGELGEIAIRGPNVMLGYWNRPDATADAIRDGWFHTGDIGKRDEDGYFYIVDRLKDMINVAGMKVYPAMVENVLYQHPSVAEAAVYGVPDPMTEERVVAQVIPKAGHEVDEEELLALCRRHIADYKVPDRIAFVETLPTSKTGKILKRVLRERTAHS